jgi:predicted transcriptional regulator
MTGQTEELEFLLRSENRTELLAALAAEGPLDRYDLEEALGTSRRTVSRTLKKLETRNYISETDGGHRLTAFGAAVFETYREYTRRIDTAERLRPFLGNIDGEALDIELSALQGAKLTLADDASPYAPMDRTLELRARSSRIREIAPSVEKRSIEQLTERIERGDDATFEIVLTADAAQAAQSKPEYEKAHRITQGADNVDQFVYRGEFPFFLGVLDETVAIGAVVDGSPFALIESRDERLREWAEQKIDQFRSEAVPMGKIAAD